MNYLAHFHIAHETQTSLVGAMLGDFIKGRQHLDLADDLMVGVILHRKVDAFTEEDPLIKRGKAFFERSQRRFAGIALDVYWDHCLAKNFDRYASEPLTVFVQRVYNTFKTHGGRYVEGYHLLTNAMIDYDWLNHYAHFDGVRRALQGLSRRRSFLEPLSDCVPSLERHQESLDKILLLCLW